MKPINRYQGLFVLREILSKDTDLQQFDTLTIWSLALKQVGSRRRSIEVDPVQLADDEGIAWNRTLRAIERLTEIGAFLFIGGRYAINPDVGPPELRRPRAPRKPRPVDQRPTETAE